MEVQELKQLIKSKDIPKFLIFTGDESAVQDIYIKQIAKTVNLELRYIDSITDVWSGLGSKSFLNTNYCYVVRDDKELMTNEKLYTELQHRLKSDMLILRITSVDKRLKFYKTYKSSFIEFNTLKSEMLKKYIQREIDLSDTNCDRLIEACEGNYGSILLEIDKIKNYLDSCDDRETTYNQVFKWLLEDGTIYTPPKDALWEFIKAVLQNKARLAYKLYYDLQQLQTPVLSVLTNLYNNIKQVLQVQECTVKDIEQNTGLTAWQIRNAKECVKRFKSADLMYFMRMIQRVESGIKQGLIDESIAVDYVLTNIL